MTEKYTLKELIQKDSGVKSDAKVIKVKLLV